MSCLRSVHFCRVPQTLSIAKRRQSLKHLCGRNFYCSTSVAGRHLSLCERSARMPSVAKAEINSEVLTARLKPCPDKDFRHKDCPLRHGFYWTVIVTVAVLRPKAFVAYSVYVVVCVGVTATLVPRTAPAPGETIRYDADDVLQFRVTGVPAETLVVPAVKLVIVGAAPCGTFDAV